ncbi:MAG: hypothetical protein V1764_03985 [Nitrospirota bacterium]
MFKKYLILIIPLIAFIAVGILSGNVYSLGHYKSQSGIGGTVEDCNICHDFANGYYESPPTNFNLRWVRTTINGKTVKFTAFSGSDGTLADANPPTDGACQVCHTITSYWRNDGSGNDHFPGQNCTACHLHFLDDITNYFEPRFVGGQSHFTHFDDPKGPQLTSDSCFTACHKSSSDFKIFKDNQPIATTTVCNACHSPNGSFNGVGDMDPGNPNSVAYGAKYNWEDGIYEPATPPDLWPSMLKAGKENWCAGCHDNGSSVVKGVSAPNVMGDNNYYGYNKTGHARNSLNPIYCGDCHALSTIHTDSNSRTYSAASNNYQAGYRLSKSIVVPRLTAGGLHSYDICLDCHNGVIALDPFAPDSGFRNDDRDKQLHQNHLLGPESGTVCWDSDWNGTTANCTGANEGDCADSTISCTACHNVHGSPCLDQFNIVQCLDPLRAPMIRHGELISTPGTTDKVPAFRFNWYDGDGDHTTIYNDSVRGGMLCAGPSKVMYNKVCWGCHDLGEVRYHRSPGGPEMVAVYNVWTTDTDPASTPKTTFSPGDPIRYHVSFKVNGPLSYYVRANGNAKNTSGSAWSYNFNKHATIPVGEYEWTWDKTVPATATHGSTAQVKITVKMFYYQGGTLISSDNKIVPFNIQ